MVGKNKRSSEIRAVIKNKSRGMLLLFLVFSIVACENPKPQSEAPQPQPQLAPDTLVVQQEKRVTPQEVPVLCYHHIKENSTGKNLAYTISTRLFTEHMRMLHDSGYHSILPTQLLQHLTTGTPLPPKPIIISFDDGHAEHYSVAAPILEQYQFKGTFFIMGVVIGKRNYISSSEIKELDIKGHGIASHTWDHPNLKSAKEIDWQLQLVKPKQRLETITGKPVQFLAYPHGAWSDSAVKAVQRSGYQAAFQLAQKQSTMAPLFTIRRLMVAGSWKPATLHSYIKRM